MIFKHKKVYQHYQRKLFKLVHLVVVEKEFKKPSIKHKATGIEQHLQAQLLQQGFGQAQQLAANQFTQQIAI
jgi:hypothetical protein